MKNLILVILALLISIPAIAKDPIRTIEGTVIKVSDGDTIQAVDSHGTKVKIRLYGIDCPETEKSSRRTGRVSKPGQPYGEEAYRALQGKLQRQYGDWMSWTSTAMVAR